MRLNGARCHRETQFPDRICFEGSNLAIKDVASTMRLERHQCRIFNQMADV
jgi:hypothetical protein